MQGRLCEDARLCEVAPGSGDEKNIFLRHNLYYSPPLPENSLTLLSPHSPHFKNNLSLLSPHPKPLSQEEGLKGRKVSLALFVRRY